MVVEAPRKHIFFAPSMVIKKSVWPFFCVGPFVMSIGSNSMGGFMRVFCSGNPFIFQRRRQGAFPPPCLDLLSWEKLQGKEKITAKITPSLEGLGQGAFWRRGQGAKRLPLIT